MAEASSTGLSSVTYADIADVETKLEDVDTAVTAFQHVLSQRVLAKRAALATDIPHFWPLVFEQAPPDVDQYIQPSDSALFAACLTGVHVDRFECTAAPDAFSKLASADGSSAPSDLLGEPRSVSFRFEFAENDWFTDRVLEKKFWFRRACDGWAGRVSEPVKIHWKPGKDLTDGLLDAAVALWEAQKKAGLLDIVPDPKAKKPDDKSKDLPEYKSLADKVEDSVEGNQSFFAWFGYRGRWVSQEENKIATKLFLEEDLKSKAEQADKNGDAAAADEADEADDDEDLGLSEAAAEIFFDGEELALAIAEDIWPNATKFFLEAQEEADDEDLSEGSFDDEELEAMHADDDDDDDADGNVDHMDEIRALAKRKGRLSGDSLPPKKRKA